MIEPHELIGSSISGKYIQIPHEIVRMQNNFKSGTLEKGIQLSDELQQLESKGFVHFWCETPGPPELYQNSPSAFTLKAMEN